ncbi:LytR/AlgR family response regulator transcription factor [Viridibacillus sp. NPDC096237]|uniref:LytR/AlgR family response regulator transcription factor n=1 Tax=Viridibacillus sp. NPDC096237 TaxID=3390721 RepID=UPI003CFCF2A8
MESIRALIVDDELYNREELKHLLSGFSSILIVGEAKTGEEAIMQAIQLQPDVVLLDVEMPSMNGMEVAKSLRALKKVPLIIFSTAYPQFAAEAFRYEAVDYLLKPYDEEEMKQAVERVKNKLQFQPVGEQKKNSGKLAVEVEGEIVYLNLEIIYYFSREDKITKIMTQLGEYETKAALKDLEFRLHSYSFFRIHKGFLVNLKYIKGLSPWFNGAYQLEIEGQESLLPVSRNYVKGLRKSLEI